MTYFLAIETSCDETAAAVFTEELRVLSSVVASQTDLHARFGGVVPEIAARAHMRNLLPTIEEALRKGGLQLGDIGCIAVHNTPGLVGALLMGVSAAKALSFALGVPLIAVNHIAAHIYASRLAAERDIYPCVGLVVSGGHTALFRCDSPLDMTLLGNTRDDAAGEAFDKVAAIMGLGFPGGPAVEREAAAGNPSAHRFPRAFLDDDRLEFSFSGLKTAVLYAFRGQNCNPKSRPICSQRTDPEANPQDGGRIRSDLAASFQAAVTDVLAEKSRQALKLTGLRRLAVGGGVTANRSLRERLKSMCEQIGAELFIPPWQLCTDNAAMAALAVEKWQKREFASADLDAEPHFI